MQVLGGFPKQFCFIDNETKSNEQARLKRCGPIQANFGPATGALKAAKTPRK
jgi:hypothetical protein